MMKNAAILLTALAAQTQAQVIRSTDQECFNNEGGRYVEACSDVYFLTCDVYEILEDEVCNVFTFSDSRLTWLTAEINVYYWSFYIRQDLESDQAYTADDFGTEEDNSICYPDSETPTKYNNGAVINYTGGMCGTKYQVTNVNLAYSNTFKVLKDNAAMLVAGSAFMLAATLAF